jgi:PPK2 family polyphosphate:nucleotide phosphotransferase
MTDDALVNQLRVEPGTAAGISKRDTTDTLGFDNKKAARARLDELTKTLAELHDRLWAEATRSVLLVLQGMDASGKDGAIAHVLSGLNPQGCSVASFKAPTETEKAHDYLWRVHAVCPPRGLLGVFNRSHYEDVLAARFAGAATHEQCRLRYRHLREFERMLTEEGTTLVKVHLHLSNDEQRARLQARIDDPTKNWKFRMRDLEVREQWDVYMDAYEEVLTETSFDRAPWYVVPADRKWVRDVAISTLLVDTLRRLDPKFPPPDPELEGVVVE